MTYEEAMVEYMEEGRTGYVGTAKEIAEASAEIIRQKDESDEYDGSDQEVHPVFSDILSRF